MFDSAERFLDEADPIGPQDPGGDRQEASRVRLGHARSTRHAVPEDDPIWRKTRRRRIAGWLFTAVGLVGCVTLMVYSHEAMGNPDRELAVIANLVMDSMG